MDSSEPSETDAATPATTPATTPAAASAAEAGSAGRRHKENASGAAPPSLTTCKRVELDVLRNACYHEDRASYFASVHRWMMFCVVLTGSSAFVALAGFLPDWWKLQSLALAGPIGAVIGLIDLVFDPTGKARLHDRLRRESILLLADVQDCRIAVEKLDGALTRLYADDPPTMHAVNALAYNRAMEAHGRDRDDLLKVGFWARAFRHLRSFDVDSFQSFRDNRSRELKPR
jgi:hypothetical protein